MRLWFGNRVLGFKVLGVGTPLHSILCGLPVSHGQLHPVFAPNMPWSTLLVLPVPIRIVLGHPVTLPFELPLSQLAMFGP